MTVSANDSARSESNGTSFAPNYTSIDYSANGFIKIDNYSPKLHSEERWQLLQNQILNLHVLFDQ